MGVIREIWDTLHALVVIITHFFKRWFLPIHGDEDPETDDRWDFSDDKEPLQPAEAGKDEPVVSTPEALSYDPDEPQPVTPVIAPPPDGEERVARGASSTFADNDSVENQSSPDVPPESAGAPESSEAPPSDETNPFSHDHPTERS